MRCKKLSILSTVVLAVFVTAVLITATHAAAQTEIVLHSFENCTFAPPYSGGCQPDGGLTFDAAGNLYGTTYLGGTHNMGTVFELSPVAGGGWSAQVLYNFGPDTPGSGPIGNLIFDAAGNLYGTTLCSRYLCTGRGTVFELIHQPNGSWRKKVLHNFRANDGSNPAGLAFDALGNIYGTTYSDGPQGKGTVFKFSPTAGGGWAWTNIYNFRRHGQRPSGGVILDAAGNLYGTTDGGGDYYDGTAFELTPTVNGSWTETVLHSFGNGEDGVYPLAGLIFDAAGNLYGTTYQGGSAGGGTMFELTPAGDGTWTETSFDVPLPGAAPYYGSLLLDPSGNLYGTTSTGGGGYGTIFEFSPTGSGSWTGSVLFNFTQDDGRFPVAGLIRDNSGNLYGTTELGGEHGGGTVFELQP